MLKVINHILVIQRILAHDIDTVIRYYPKLTYCSEGKKEYLKGYLDICDTKGNYWDTFLIKIIIPEKYPYGVPILIELKNKIRRIDERHISEEGICCVDIDHELLYLSRKGIRLIDFMNDKVYPFFANQVYYDNEKKYVSEEYEHHFNGVVQFYHERLKLTRVELIISILELVLSNKIPGRNDNCLCNSGKKTKNFHGDAFNFLKWMGKERIQKDLNGFIELKTTN